MEYLRRGDAYHIWCAAASLVSDSQNGPVYRVRNAECGVRSDASVERGVRDYGLDTLLTKGDGGRDGVFGFPERALAGLGWVSFR